MTARPWRWTRLVQPLVREEGERDGECGHVEPVGRGEAGGRDEKTGESGSADHPDRPAERVEGARGRELVALDEPRQGGFERRSLEPAQADHGSCQDEEEPELLVREERVRTECAGRERERELGQLHHPPPVDGIREGAADEGGQRSGLSSTSPSRPTAMDEPVSWNTW